MKPKYIQELDFFKNLVIETMLEMKRPDFTISAMEKEIRSTGQKFSNWKLAIAVMLLVQDGTLQPMVKDGRQWFYEDMDTWLPKFREYQEKR